MRALIWLARRWTWLTKWRAKVVVGIILLCLIPLPGVVAAYGRNVWVALALCPLAPMCGWLSGRLIGLAAVQREREKAHALIAALQDKGIPVDHIV